MLVVLQGQVLRGDAQRDRVQIADEGGLVDAVDVHVPRADGLGASGDRRDRDPRDGLDDGAQPLLVLKAHVLGHQDQVRGPGGVVHAGDAGIGGRGQVGVLQRLAVDVGGVGQGGVGVLEFVAVGGAVGAQDVDELGHQAHEGDAGVVGPGRGDELDGQGDEHLVAQLGVAGEPEGAELLEVEQQVRLLVVDADGDQRRERRGDLVGLLGGQQDLQVTAVQRPGAR